MKKILPVLLFTLLPAFSSAQDSRRTRPTEGPSRPRVMVPARAKLAPVKTNALDENITLYLKGNFQGFVPLDLTLTGNGSSFSSDLITKAAKEGDPPVISKMNGDKLTLTITKPEKAE